MVRERLALLINQETDMETCGEAGDAESALKVIRQKRPDLVILDITLRGASGIDLLKQLKADLPEIAVLILSMHEETLYAERVLRAGASGYITKHECTDEIATAIRKVLSGDVYLSESMVAGVIRGMSGAGRKGQKQTIEHLTDRELEVFTLFGRGYALDEVASMLDMARPTVCTHRTRIKTKLGIRSAGEFLHIATKWVYDNDRS